MSDLVSKELRDALDDPRLRYRLAEAARFRDTSKIDEHRLEVLKKKKAAEKEQKEGIDELMALHDALQKVIRDKRGREEKAVTDIIDCFLCYQASFGLGLTWEDMKKEAVGILRKFVEKQKGEEDE